jgi:hypothetical protein
VERCITKLIIIKVIIISLVVRCIIRVVDFQWILGRVDLKRGIVIKEGGGYAEIEFKGEFFILAGSFRGFIRKGETKFLEFAKFSFSEALPLDF